MSGSVGFRLTVTSQLYLLLIHHTSYSSYYTCLWAIVRSDNKMYHNIDESSTLSTNSLSWLLGSSFFFTIETTLYLAQLEMVSSQGHIPMRRLGAAQDGRLSGSYR